MKRLIIVCEGETEADFCFSTLAQELIKSEIYVEAPLIKQSKGGIVGWETLKRQIESHLHEGDAYVSLLLIIMELRIVLISLDGRKVRELILLKKDGNFYVPK